MFFKNAFTIIIIMFSNAPSFIDSQGVSSLLTLTEFEVKQICQGFEFQFLAHPSNQQNYIICVPGGGVEKECPANQCFDERNPPCSTNCNPNISPADQTVKDQCNADDTPLLDAVANDKDCNSYYICVGKNVDPLPQKCPANLHYSAEQKTCLSYYEANCEASSKWCKKKRDGTRFPHTNCYEFYECENERTLTKSCLYGEHFSGDLGKCVSGICQQDRRTPDCKDVNDGVRVAHPKCYKYYVCLKQSLFEAHCPSGYYFNKLLNSCARDVNNICNDI